MKPSTQTLRGRGGPLSIVIANVAKQSRRLQLDCVVACAPRNDGCVGAMLQARKTLIRCKYVWGIDTGRAGGALRETGRTDGRRHGGRQGAGSAACAADGRRRA